MSIKLFTSESVTEGHPDKVCDRISDAILDEILMKYGANEDRMLARTAVETLATTGMVLVAGEVTCDVYVEIPDIVRRTVKEIGYDSEEQGFDGNTCAVLTTLHEQSDNISRAVNRFTGEDYLKGLSAGDQGIMFGYATDETPELMPMPIMIAHKLAHKLSEVRKSGQLAWVKPDGKTQVTVEYDEKGKPVGIDTIIVSTMHSMGISPNDIRAGILESVIAPVAADYGFALSGRQRIECLSGGYFNIRFDGAAKDTRVFINPSGLFVLGGPNADTGLTGRKIIVDTYGGMANHGGGCFSGKDATKVDRSGNYAARYVAKNIVASGLAREC
jgi:S-adenosylmethionine synthetase